MKHSLDQKQPYGLYFVLLLGLIAFQSWVFVFLLRKYRVSIDCLTASKLELNVIMFRAKERSPDVGTGPIEKRVP